MKEKEKKKKEHRLLSVVPQGFLKGVRPGAVCLGSTSIKTNFHNWGAAKAKTGRPDPRRPSHSPRPSEIDHLDQDHQAIAQLKRIAHV